MKNLYTQTSFLLRIILLYFQSSEPSSHTFGVPIFRPLPLTGFPAQRDAVTVCSAHGSASRGISWKCRHLRKLRHIKVRENHIRKIGEISGEGRQLSLARAGGSTGVANCGSCSRGRRSSRACRLFKSSTFACSQCITGSFSDSWLDILDKIDERKRRNLNPRFKSLRAATKKNSAKGATSLVFFYTLPEQ